MRKADDFVDVSGLAAKYMKPDALTNNYMQADEYRSLIAAGSLYIHEWSGGLFLLCKMEGRHLLRFHLIDNDIDNISDHNSDHIPNHNSRHIPDNTPDNIPEHIPGHISLPDAQIPSDTVAEYAYKPSGAARAARALEVLARFGFAPRFERIRMTRPAGYGESSSKSGYDIRVAGKHDFGGVRSLLHSSFDLRTGCLPDDARLQHDILAGGVFCIGDGEGAVSALLRVSRHPRSSEINHLAVREDSRGRGAAGALLSEYIKHYGQERITVWVRDGYAPAQRAYASAGFAPDGLRSYVLGMRN